MCKCFQIGGPFIAEDPDCPVHGANKDDFDPENHDCGHECHKVGGPFIGADPECPVHGDDTWKHYRD